MIHHRESLCGFIAMGNACPCCSGAEDPALFQQETIQRMCRAAHSV